MRPARCAKREDVMPVHIGIVACSAEGAALCYRTICIQGEELFGPQMHPEMTMHTHPLGAYMKRVDAGDWDAVAGLMISSAEKVALAGADFAICPDNTIHEAFDKVVGRSPIPWLHMAKAVASEAVRRGFKRCGVLGTRYLVEGPVYRDALASSGLERMVPEPDECERVNAIIFDELVKGCVSPESRAYVAGVIGRLKARGCDAVVLGCTELPLLISKEDSPLPTLDSTRILARAALTRAAG